MAETPVSITKGRELTILLTGGGTGGHITPLLAVAHELKKHQPNCRIIYVGERNGKYASLVRGNTDIDEIRTIFAGKFRRYHGESWIKRILDVKTLLLNIRDSIFFIIGTFQAVHIVRRIKPDVAFLKGGFVGVPVGLACALLDKPFVTHDSDAVPGLANRLVSRWARVHATAMKSSYYPYAEESTVHVGVLVGSKYQEVDSKLQKSYRNELNIPSDANVLMVTGGSNGAQVINKEIVSRAAEELRDNPNLFIIHQVGKGKLDVYGSLKNDRLQVKELFDDMYKYSAAADVIVTRAGANTLAEFGVQKKPCIVVPNPLLTSGHQLLNAQYLLDNDAAVIVEEKSFDEEQGSELWLRVNELLSDHTKANRLASNLNNITLKDASTRIAQLLVNISVGKDA